MKVLIISHNPITTYQNMGKTMLSLFSAFDKSEICQLYIYPTIPDINRCSSFYRITDKDVLKSYYRFHVRGKEISIEEIENTTRQIFENEKDEALYRNKKNKTAIRMLARDLMWACAHWYNKRLEEWLKRENPSCIFVVPGTAKFLYNIALKISKKFNLPIIPYICDDYYFVNKPKGFLNQIKQKLLSKKIEKLLKRSSQLVVVCEELKQHYQKRFDLPTTVIMTGSNYPIVERIRVVDNPTVITYMGNVRCDRYYSLVELGRALDNINAKNNTTFLLHIYTGEKDKDILSKLQSVKSIELRGFVGGKEFDEIFHSTEVLLHTEAFFSTSIDLVKHSVSTKIADSLGSGIPLLAYGPNKVASLAHLIRNNCAFTITNQNTLEEELLKFLSNKQQREAYAENGLLTAREYHNSDKIGELFYNIMGKINESTSNQ